MTRARAEERADIAEKSRSVLGGWRAFYKRFMAGGGDIRGLLARCLIKAIGQPVLCENLFDARTAMTLGPPRIRSTKPAAPGSQLTALSTTFLRAISRWVATLILPPSRYSIGVSRKLLMPSATDDPSRFGRPFGFPEAPGRKREAADGFPP
jgi:hypothetical protein